MFKVENFLIQTSCSFLNTQIPFCPVTTLAVFLNLMCLLVSGNEQYWLKVPISIKYLPIFKNPKSPQTNTAFLKQRFKKLHCANLRSASPSFFASGEKRGPDKPSIGGGVGLGPEVGLCSSTNILLSSRGQPLRPLGEPPNGAWRREVGPWRNLVVALYCRGHIKTKSQSGCKIKLI